MFAEHSAMFAEAELTPAPNAAGGRAIETLTSLSGVNRTLDTAIDLHLTNANNTLMNSTINIVSEDAFLFFDNVKPSRVMDLYASFITIHGVAMNPYTDANCRIAVYKQGTAVFAHPAGFQPLETFGGTNYTGMSQKHLADLYYSNQPDPLVPQANRATLELDNTIRSLKLKKGYMLTLATEPDGMGYSRVFIADDDDLLLPELPPELGGKVSFLRVFGWEWVSKKGWSNQYDRNQPEGFRYADEQNDVLNCTWFYNWSWTTDVQGWINPNKTTPFINQEFVPEKWGKGGNFGNFYTIKRWSHLIGFNEPDHTEQSNVTVAQAIAEWPVLMKTGARLGSPATTDFNWLYNFMSECDKRNYRVDFVVVHAYWGAKSPQNWYKDLKAVADRTGRPVWIKEWNNGANWTNESWPSGIDAQYQKQLNDLKGILTVMDTASFIERYCLYNWVEQKRAALYNGQLTPAGAFYAANNSAMAFNHANEVIPVWKFRNPPALSYTYDDAGKLNLSWTNYDGEMVTGFRLERSTDGANYETVAIIDNPHKRQYTDNILPYDPAIRSVWYRVKSSPLNNKPEQTSNAVRYDFINNTASDNPTGNIHFDNLLVKENYSVYVFGQQYSKPPVVVFGTPTYRNKMPLSWRADRLSNAAFMFKLHPWEYLQKPEFVNPDTIACLSLPEGSYNLGGITLRAGKVADVTKSWKQVLFDAPFDETPFVIASQLTACGDSAASVRVKDVTKEGFYLKLQYEENMSPRNVPEVAGYIALTPGSGEYRGRKIEAGLTAEKVAGSYNSPCKITFASAFVKPAFFGFMQTESDDITATLRIKSRGANYAEVFKDREKSLNTNDVDKETVGWLCVETADAAGSDISSMQGNTFSMRYDRRSGEIYPTTNEEMQLAEIYSVAGSKLMERKHVSRVNTSGLLSGVYLLVVNRRFYFRFIK
jgi:hypothetical protein